MVGKAFLIFKSKLLQDFRIEISLNHQVCVGEEILESFLRPRIALVAGHVVQLGVIEISAGPEYFLGDAVDADLRICCGLGWQYPLVQNLDQQIFVESWKSLLILLLQLRSKPVEQLVLGHQVNC